MNLQERQRLFKEQVKVTLGATTKVREAFGVSNRAILIENGIFIGTLNLESFVSMGEQDSLLVVSGLCFPPQDEIYFAVLIKSGIKNFIHRLESMLDSQKRNSRDDLDYGTRNNNVRLYIASNGRLYLRNKLYWESLNIDLERYEPSVKIDSIAVALYPPSASARRSLLAREFIGYLANMVESSSIHEIRPWPDEHVLKSGMRRMPSTIELTEIEESIIKLGGYYPNNEIRRIHAALNFHRRKHFVILAGISGTGKTQLGIQYAKAIHGQIDPNENNPFLFVCPVRPEWTDPTGLTGYQDILKDKYVVPPFLEAILTATAHKSSPVFVILDEMNLARVEYYFSDILSCIESGENLQLHSNSIPLEGTTGVSIRAEIPVPKNLYIIGTINVDETTNQLSDKILDRASIIDMSNVDIPGFLFAHLQRNPDAKDAIDTCQPILEKVHGVLNDFNLAFGYRLTEEFLDYFMFSQRINSDLKDTIDDLMVQKILAKLRGTERQRTLLNRLAAVIKDYPRALRHIKNLQNELDEFGSFQSSR